MGERIPKCNKSVGHFFFFLKFFAKITPQNCDFFLLASLEIFHSNFVQKMADVTLFGSKKIEEMGEKAVGRARFSFFLALKRYSHLCKVGLLKIE